MSPSLLLETNAEAKVVVAGTRVAVVALGGTQDRPGVEPGTTACDPVRARCRARWIDHRVAGRIGSVPVCGSFPNFSAHVEKAPWIGFQKKQKIIKDLEWPK